MNQPDFSKLNLSQVEQFLADLYVDLHSKIKDIHLACDEERMKVLEQVKDGALSAKSLETVIQLMKSREFKLPDNYVPKKMAKPVTSIPVPECPMPHTATPEDSVDKSYNWMEAEQMVADAAKSAETLGGSERAEHVEDGYLNMKVKREVAQMLAVLIDFTDWYVNQPLDKSNKMNSTSKLLYLIRNRVDNTEHIDGFNLEEGHLKLTGRAQNELSNTLGSIRAILAAVVPAKRRGIDL